MAPPTFLFAHGAGASSSSPWMQAWTERLGALGRVIPFDYPYMRAGRRAPDRLPKLVEAHRAALVEARAVAEGPVVLAGKSMGSRVGCHLALEEPVAGLVCLGYPLKALSKTAKIRDEVLLALGTPILFVQGSRDRMGPLDLLADVRGRMSAPSVLHVVEGGDHSLTLSKTHIKATGTTQEAVNAGILDAIQAFVATLS